MRDVLNEMRLVDGEVSCIMNLSAELDTWEYFDAIVPLKQTESELSVRAAGVMSEGVSAQER